MARRRLDLLMTERGLVGSREQARRVIMAGKVLVEGKRVDKAGTPVPTGAAVTLTAPDHPYVSRGGVKLAAALDAFGIAPTGQICLDVGASTGGFTDCLLKRGAHRVYAVDVGHGQIHERLRADPRVVLLERVNARYLSPLHVPEPIGIATLDLAFISLTLVWPAIVPLLRDRAVVLPLVKPQFEVGKGQVGQGGVVRSALTQRAVLVKVAVAAEACGLMTRGMIASPLLGPKGNREFFLFLERGTACREPAETVLDRCWSANLTEQGTG